MRGGDRAAPDDRVTPVSILVRAVYPRSVVAGYADRAGFLGHADRDQGSNRGPVGRRSDCGATNDDGSGLHVRRSPERGPQRRRSPTSRSGAYSGQPGAVRVYSDDEQDNAARYASEVGGAGVPLRLSALAGFRLGCKKFRRAHADGNFVRGRHHRTAGVIRAIFIKSLSNQHCRLIDHRKGGRLKRLA